MAKFPWSSKEVSNLYVVVIGTSLQGFKTLLGDGSTDAHINAQDSAGDASIVIEQDFMEGDYAFHFSTLSRGARDVRVPLWKAVAVVFVYDHQQPDKVRTDLREYWIPKINDVVSEEIPYYLVETHRPTPGGSGSDNKRPGSCLYLEDPSNPDVRQLYDLLPGTWKAFRTLEESDNSHRFYEFLSSLFDDAKACRKNKKRRHSRYCLLS